MKYRTSGTKQKYFLAQLYKFNRYNKRWEVSMESLTLLMIETTTSGKSNNNLLSLVSAQ